LSNLAKGLIVVALVLAMGAGLVFWKNKYGGHGAGGSLNRITKEDMAILLKDAPPMQLKQLDTPEQKKKIAESLRQLLAVASQARKEGIADEPANKRELEDMQMIMTAQLYDQKANGDKGPLPAFSSITEDQTKEFYNDPKHEAEFNEFLESKLALARESGRFPADKELSEEEKNQAKDDYAKIRISAEAAEAKKGELGEDFERALDLQVKLQQAQFLAGQYSKKVLTDKVKVSDEDVDKYIAEHPEMSPDAKKAKAEEILKRAQSGEDFAKLADENSQDPGNTDPKGEKQGGLYKDVTMGKMMPDFEKAALSVEPGKVVDHLIETPYGYHVIKLEKKGTGKGADGKPAETYDVRHVLITTTMKDPENPFAREMPVKDFVRQKLETEKQKQILDEIVAKNPVEVPEDFDVPQVSDEQMQQLMQQQMMQQGGPGMMPPPGAEGAQDSPDVDAPAKGAKPSKKPAAKK
jgi:parvulin-like peptidyl-prolyl isomerase